MTDNSDWLTRLLIKERARHYYIPSILKFITHNKKLCFWASLLWGITLLLIFLESLSALGIVSHCLSPLRVISINFLSSFAR